jgi:hypothetical protein
MYTCKYFLSKLKKKDQYLLIWHTII